MPQPNYRPQLPGVFRITHSDLETYLECGLRWLLKKELKHRRSTVAQMIGTGIAGAQKADLQVKHDTGIGLRLGQIVDAGVAAYEAERSECEVEAPKIQIANGKDETAAAASCYGTEVSPLYDKINAVEKQIVGLFTMDLSPSETTTFEVAGTPDVMTPNGIGDTKTGQPWTQERADRTRQLTMYGWLFRVAEEKWPAELWIDSLSRTKAGWRHERLYTTREIEDYVAAGKAIAAAKKGIEAEVYLPAPSSSWRCSAKWCEFYGKGCPAVSGRERKL